ncbi:MAG: CAAD domain-containing protein [Aphanocapsa sp. GSE-SYN-MK-11-07L]|jgi:glutamyl-tRNA synthetase|nr:CAAD domain-containing protein [Aphanocapsa sp. GSE-SYN-MK-11-07L]
MAETEIVQINPSGEVETNPISVEIPAAETSIVVHGLESDPDQESWRLFQVKMTAFFENVTAYTTAFFQNNRPLLNRLGWLALAFLGIRLLFGAVDALDDIPLVSTLLELIGFVYTLRFVWRYLIRESDRQELNQRLNQFKSEVFGSPT